MKRRTTANFQQLFFLHVANNTITIYIFLLAARYRNSYSVPEPAHRPASGRVATTPRLHPTSGFSGTRNDRAHPSGPSTRAHPLHGTRNDECTPPTLPRARRWPTQFSFFLACANSLGPEQALAIFFPVKKNQDVTRHAGSISCLVILITSCGDQQETSCQLLHVAVDILQLYDNYSTK